MDQLSAHLRRLAAEPFQYGRCDCLLALADWVALRTGVDLGGEFRGKYKNERGWKRIVVRAGGMRTFVGELLLRVGWLEVTDPRPGDIGVLIVSADRGPCGALRGERHWHMKTASGLAAVMIGSPIQGTWGPR